MEVDVLLFGPAASAVGADRISVRLDGERTVAALRGAIHEQHRVLRDVLAAGCIAVNHAYAAPGTELCAGDEAALIALVSGG